MENLQTDYSTSAVALGYKCSRCDAVGCKLWRQYQTFLDHIDLLCLACAERDQDSFCKYSVQAPEIIRRWQEMWDAHAVRNSTRLDTEEKRELSDLHMRAESDSIGWLVPAVPTKEGDTFWGYTSVPLEGIEWWKRLPIRGVTRLIPTPQPGPANPQG